MNEIILQKLDGVGLFHDVNHTIKYIRLECAEIITKKQINFEKLCRSKRFSHYDTLICYNEKKKGISMGSSCVDEKFGSVFGVSATRYKITLVPQHNLDLKSFADYFNMICRYFDKNSEIIKTSDYNKRRKVIL